MRLPKSSEPPPETMAALYRRGGWKPQVGRKFPLAQAADAHRLQEDNSTHKHGSLSGKIVLVP